MDSSSVNIILGMLPTILESEQYKSLKKSLLNEFSEVGSFILSGMDELRKSELKWTLKKYREYKAIGMTNEQAFDLVCLDKKLAINQAGVIKVSLKEALDKSVKGVKDGIKGSEDD